MLDNTVKLAEILDIKKIVVKEEGAELYDKDNHLTFVIKVPVSMEDLKERIQNVEIIGDYETDFKEEELKQSMMMADKMLDNTVKLAEVLDIKKIAVKKDGAELYDKDDKLTFVIKVPLLIEDLKERVSDIEIIDDSKNGLKESEE